MIYFIQVRGGGPIKIGFTQNHPRSRFVKMQSDCPFELEMLGAVPGSVAEEKAIHAELQDSKTQGEWFLPNEAVMAVVNGHLARPDRWNPEVPGREWKPKHSHPLEAYRCSRQETLERLAGRLGFSIAFMSRMIAGKAQPSVQTAKHIQKITGVSAIDLLGLREAAE
jgi:hypothetical protein